MMLPESIAPRPSFARYQPLSPPCSPTSMNTVRHPAQQKERRTPAISRSTGREGNGSWQWAQSPGTALADLSGGAPRARNLE